MPSRFLNIHTSFLILGGPQTGYGHYDETYGPPPPPPHYEGRRMGPPMGRGRGGPHYGGTQYGHGPPPPDYSSHADSPVVMVYGLEPTKINADRVFNIFCLYGNVERVRWCCFWCQTEILIQLLLLCIMAMLWGLFWVTVFVCDANSWIIFTTLGYFLGEVHEEQARCCNGGDGRLFCCG